MHGQRNIKLRKLSFINDYGKRLLFSTKCPYWLWSLAASFSTDIKIPSPAVKMSERETVDISLFSVVVNKTDNAGIIEH